MLLHGLSLSFLDYFHGVHRRQAALRLVRRLPAPRVFARFRCLSFGPKEHTANMPFRDRADAAFLIPHEALRHEMQAMRRSVDALNPNMPAKEFWKAKNFCEWYRISASRLPVIRLGCARC